MKGFSAADGAFCVRIDDQDSSFGNHGQRGWGGQDFYIIVFCFTFSQAYRLFPRKIADIAPATEFYLVAFMGGKDPLGGVEGLIIFTPVIQVVDPVEFGGVKVDR